MLRFSWAGSLSSCLVDEIAGGDGGEGEGFVEEEGRLEISLLLFLSFLCSDLLLVSIYPVSSLLLPIKKNRRRLL